MPTLLSSARRRSSLAGWPGACPVCGLWTTQGICHDCTERHAQPQSRCLRCAEVLEREASECVACVNNPPPVSCSIAAVDYGFPWDRLILAFKFGGQPELARPLGGLMFQALQRRPGTSFERVDAIVPVPLWGARLAERGYNQSWELARGLMRLSGKPGRPDVLQRTRPTAVQSLLKRSERAANLRGAFAPTPQARRWIAGRRIALVDDVMTSGVTAFEAAQALRDSGASEVHLWVLARAAIGRNTDL